MEQKKLSEMLGISTEDISKQKEMVPAFDLKKVGVGGRVIGDILAVPEKIEWVDKDTDESKKGVIMSVLIKKIIQPDGITVEMGEKMVLWLSSKTLSMGMMRLAENDNAETLIGKQFVIKVKTVVYKKFGENRCYEVAEI